MFTKYKSQFDFGGQQVTLETGMIARQATAAVMVTMGDTMVLATVVAKKKASTADFFPLTVNYQEKTYSAGKIPGGFFRREGRPSEKETLTCRLIDRPIRPLFPSGYNNEVQIVCTVVSSSSDYDPDIAALIGASAALSISGAPFQGPIAAARVSINEYGDLLLNPKIQVAKESGLDMVVAGTKDAVLMVESRASELSEEKMLEAVLFAHENMQKAIEAIEQLAAQVNTPSWNWQAPELDADIVDHINTNYSQKVADAYRVTEKQERNDQLSLLRKEFQEKYQAIEDVTAREAALDDAASAFKKLEKSTVRNWILDEQPRIDGRDNKTVRPIDVQTSLLPRAHGSALFTRGETQAIVVATLASLRDSQIVDALEGEYRDQFMLHYNFPPYCVGETGFMSGPKRREIGHGWLARRGIHAVLPKPEDFPYTLRVVSEITESNGSSSMASVCGTSLALMDAGVKIKAPVAGVAMGLVKDGERFAVLTDILGDEDHLGDMDFKVAGTAYGITALQMDIKITGINREIMEAALSQARDGRLHILGEMNKALAAPRTEMSPHAPSIILMSIHPDKIRDVIGKGGSVIRQIVEDTGAEVDIDDDGTVRIYGKDQESADKAKAKVDEITEDAEVGKVYSGVVRTITDFGAFVNILPGKDGLVHVSEIADHRVENVRDHLTEGDTVNVLLKEIDAKGRMKLSIKAIKN